LDQLVIPPKVRKHFGIKSGTVIHFIYSNGEIKIVQVTKETISTNFGIFGTKGKVLKALKKEKKI